MPTWVVSAFLDDDLLALNRAVGIIRRRNLGVPSITLGPSPRAGVSRLSCIVEGDAAAIERLANQLRKMVGVHSVLWHPASECASREHILVRVRLSPAQLSGLLDTLALYEAGIVEENLADLLIEATGTPPFMTTFLRALEPFGILDLARGGTLALPPAPLPDSVGTQRTPTIAGPVATAIPA